MSDRVSASCWCSNCGDQVEVCGVGFRCERVGYSRLPITAWHFSPRYKEIALIIISIALDCKNMTKGFLAILVLAA